MAKNNTCSNKTLNANAPPYLKISPTLCHTHTFPHCMLYYHSLQPLIPFHFQPHKSFPHPLPPPPPSQPPSLSSSKRNKNLAPLTPVPWGPRVSMSGYGRRVRGGKKNSGTVKVVGPQAEAGFGGRKRWKNKSGDYHQTLPLESKTTSVMIKNIPNKYTRELLIQTLDNHCKSENEKTKNVDSLSAYDHLYLPMDFKNRVNAGFAFVNFTTSEAAMKFRDAFHGKSWDFFGSPKVAEVCRAKIQGKEAIIKNSKMMDFSSGSGEDLPVLFEPARDGLGRVSSRMFQLGRFFN